MESELTIKTSLALGKSSQTNIFTLLHEGSQYTSIGIRKPVKNSITSDITIPNKIIRMI